MAVSSRGASIGHRELNLIIPSLNLNPKNITTLFGLNYSNYANLITRKAVNWRFSIRSSMDTSTAIEEEEEYWEGSETSSPVEVPKGTPSLISALNVEKSLRGIAITDTDHYGRLGLQRGCTYDQVGVAYKNKISEVSSQGLEEEELNTKLELLKESYTILSSEEERRLYDWSLVRSENPDRYVWPYEVDITQTPRGGTPPPQEPEDVGPTRVVGYFLLGWLVLGFTLSIVLNR